MSVDRRAVEGAGAVAAAAMVALLLRRYSLPFPVLVLGLVSGMTYGILAVGLVLIYRANRIVNFAHGEVGAFAAAALGLWVVKFGLPYWLMFAGAVALAAGAGILVEVVAIRRLRRAPKVMSIVATLGASSFLLMFSFAINTQVRRGADYPQPPGMPRMEIGALVLTPSYSAMLLFTPLIVAALALFLRRTRYGIAIRATADNPESAQTAGISTSRMSALAWGIAGAISAYTAILQFPAKGFVVTGQSLGPGLLVRALAAGVMARLTNFPTAFVAGIGIGVLEQAMLWNNPSGGQVEAILFAVILVTLLLQRRQGSREEEQGSWLAVQSWRPLPEALQEVWAVRHLGKLASAAGLVLLACVLLTTNRAALVFTTIASYSLIGLSIYVVTGLGGQLSLGQFAFAGIGATVSYHVVSSGAGFPAGFLAAGLATALVSVLIGIPALRMRGLMLAVTTLALAVMAEAWLFQQEWTLGAGVDPGKPIIGSTVLQTAKQYYVFALPFLIFGVWLAWNVRRGGIGRALVALRDNEDGARAFGVRAVRTKLLAFALAGFLAGLGGAVYAHSLSRISFATFAAGQGITLVAMSAIGGLGIIAGPLVGALYLLALPAFVPLDAAGLAASSLGWLILILYFPGGLAQLVQPLRERLVDLLARASGADPARLRAQESVVEKRPALLLDTLTVRRAEGVRGGVVLSVRGVSKSFGGVRAVDGVSLDVRRGETLGVIGPNGAGKTTLFELISGFTIADAGTIVFEGRDITRTSPESRVSMGLVRSFQDLRLFPTMTVLETVRLAQEHERPTRFLSSLFALPPALRSERDKEARAREVVAAMGLDPYRNKQIGELSTGTRRITELACLLSLSPKLLLLDEPSSGIAQRETEALGELLVRLKGVLDTTFVVIEHDMPLIMGISDRIVAMESGRVIAEGTPERVRRDPVVIESYLGGDLRTIQRSGATDGRCRGTTRTGQRCARQAAAGGFCRQHAAEVSRT